MTPFLRNTWYVAMWSEDLAPGALFSRAILDEPIVFFRKADGGIAALVDVCPHRLVPLSLGKLLSGDRLRCAYHRLEFGADGRCVHNPHGNQAIPAARTAVYPVAERYSLVWIWMGDRPADPSAIPDYSLFDRARPEETTKRDYLLIESGYEYMTSNLLDLSHISFLHEGLLGTEDAIAAETMVEQQGNTVWVTRASKNIRPAEMTKLILGLADQRTDNTTIMRWDPPGCLLNDSGAIVHGGRAENMSGLLGAHLLTPETAQTTHYHFAAVRKGTWPQGAELAKIAARLSEIRRLAFEEQDAPIMRAQQKLANRLKGRQKPMLLGIDAGAARAARILHSLIETERRS